MVVGGGGGPPPPPKKRGGGGKGGKRPPPPPPPPTPTKFIWAPYPTLVLEQPLGNNLQLLDPFCLNVLSIHLILHTPHPILSSSKKLGFINCTL